jgi:predicted nucleic acid-binding protein
MPQTLLIDSDILIDHLRKEQSALDYISREIGGESSLFISVISRIEILSGARKGEGDWRDPLLTIIGGGRSGLSPWGVRGE